jgi:hypothetical protein
MEARGHVHSLLSEATAAKDDEGDYTSGQLEIAAQQASIQAARAGNALQDSANAHQQARERAAKVTAAATELLHAHGVRREQAAELRKAAAALGIAAESAVADVDAAATVKQCLEVHCIDTAAISRHQAACKKCRQLYRELLQLCSKLGLPAPPGAPTAAATAVLLAEAEAAASPPPEWTAAQLELLAVKSSISNASGAHPAVVALAWTPQGA